MKNGAMQIFDERNRQVLDEGFDEKHDSEHSQGELIQAAIAYALADSDNNVAGMGQNTEAYAWFPWDMQDWKPSNRIHNLVKAGALIAAEIDRLQKLSNV